MTNKLEKSLSFSQNSCEVFFIPIGWKLSWIFSEKLWWKCHQRIIGVEIPFSRELSTNEKLENGWIKIVSGEERKFEFVLSMNAWIYRTNTEINWIEMRKYIHFFGKFSLKSLLEHDKYRIGKYEGFKRAEMYVKTFQKFSTISI